MEWRRKRKICLHAFLCAYVCFALVSLTVIVIVVLLGSGRLFFVEHGTAFKSVSCVECALQLLYVLCALHGAPTPRSGGI